MDFILLIISLVLSSLGTFVDMYTTNYVKNRGGLELELNEKMRNDLQRNNICKILLYQLSIIVGFALVDSWGVLSRFIFLGLFNLVARGSVGASNIRVIVESRVVGMDEYVKQRRQYLALWKEFSVLDRVGFQLNNYVMVLILLVVSGIVLFYGTSLLVIVGSMTLGLAMYFIARIVFNA